MFADYDLDPDGSRFVMLARESEDESGESWLTLVTGWFQELESRAPRDDNRTSRFVLLRGVIQAVNETGFTNRPR